MDDKKKNPEAGWKLNSFNLQMCAEINLPENPETSKATVGKDYTLYINTGTLATPIWTRIGGQRNSPLSQTADTIDVSHKGSGGYKAMLAGLKGWSISLDALAMLDDPGIDILEYAYANSKQLNIKFERPDGKYITGWASVTEFSIEPPHDGAATISGNLEGVGRPSDWTDPVTGASAAVLESDY